MTHPIVPAPNIAIACGGTGGHLFPGLAVADQLLRHGCRVTLLISPKDVDQQAAKSVRGMETVTLPAVAFQRGSRLAFFRNFVKSCLASHKLFRRDRPQAVLAMGGFTSAPPVLMAKLFGARTFLHESNTIPGRANRWLARVVDRAFIGFPEAATRLACDQVEVTGTPVRPQFKTLDPADCRKRLGLDPVLPTVLVVGGSQGAKGVNDLVLSALPLLAKRAVNWQWFHLTGPNQGDQVRQAYAAQGMKAVVHPFFAEMELALSAATAAVSRAGASSLAELAALRLPSLLVPYPTAADNHQFHNARAFENSDAAHLLEQKAATPEKVVASLTSLMENIGIRDSMQTALMRWHAPKAAEQIAELILQTVTERTAPARGAAEKSGPGDEAQLRAIA